MTVTLVVHRYKQEQRFDYETIKEAAQEALNDLEFDNAFPDRIIEGERVVWRFEGTTSLEDLKRMAGSESNGTTGTQSQ